MRDWTICDFCLFRCKQSFCLLTTKLPERGDFPQVWSLESGNLKDKAYGSPHFSERSGFSQMTEAPRRFFLHLFNLKQLQHKAILKHPSGSTWQPFLNRVCSGLKSSHIINYISLNLQNQNFAVIRQTEQAIETTGCSILFNKNIIA